MISELGGLIRRTVLATGVLLLVIVAVLGILLVGVREQHATTRMAQHSEEVLATIDQVHEVALEVQGAQQAYAISHDAYSLNRWQAAQAALPVVTARLERLADTPAQRSRARQITGTGASYLRDYSRPAVESARRGDASALSASTTREGSRRIDELAGKLGSLKASERQLLTTRNEHHRAVARSEILAIIAGLVASALGVIAVVGVYQTRVMVQPIRRAATMANRLASGEFSVRMPETGKAEMGQLERSFNIMATSLDNSHRELTQLVETQTALRRVATLVARGVPPSEVMAAVAKELAGLLGTDVARIYRFEADGTGTVVAAWGGPELDLRLGKRLVMSGGAAADLVWRTSRAARIDSYEEAPGQIADIARRQGIQAAVAAPIQVGGRLWGATAAATTRGEPPPPDAEARLAECTDLIGTAIANAQTHDDLIASRARVVLAADQARRRIERDLHDGVQQRLVSLALDVRHAEENVPPELTEVRGQLTAVLAGLTSTVDEVREISRGVHPAIVTEGGLRPALKALARRSAVPVELDLDLRTRLPEPVEVATYYVVAEALANAAKHARASRIRVRARIDDGTLSLSLHDDGVGGADPEHGSGLIGLHDRVEALGGTMTFESPLGRGTCIKITLPGRSTSTTCSGM